VGFPLSHLFSQVTPATGTVGQSGHPCPPPWISTERLGPDTLSGSAAVRCLMLGRLKREDRLSSVTTGSVP
jgi:hypothetical protein